MRVRADSDGREQEEPRARQPTGREQAAHAASIDARPRRGRCAEPAPRGRKRVRPPSTGITAPVTYAARSEARNATRSPISRGRPSRRAGIAAQVRLGRAVRVDLGQPLGVDAAGRDGVDRDALAARPRARASWPSRPRPGRTAFESARLSTGSRTVLEVMLTTRPCPLARRCGRQRFVSDTAETSRSCTACSSASASTSIAAVRGGPPPLLTRMSMPPNAARVWSTRRWRSRGLVRSPRTASAPRRSASRSSSSRRRANMATLAPSSASASAVPRPIPDDAPQTIAVRPFSPRSTASSRVLPTLGWGTSLHPPPAAERTPVRVSRVCRLRANSHPPRSRPRGPSAREDGDDLAHGVGRRVAASGAPRPRGRARGSPRCPPAPSLTGTPM